MEMTLLIYHDLQMNEHLSDSLSIAAHFTMNLEFLFMGYEA